MAVAALAGVWAQASAPPSPSARPATGPVPGTVADGLSLRLAELGAAPLPGISAVPGADGVWRVRGRTAAAAGPAAGWPAPLYAEAARLCDAELERAACWRVDLIEIDGRPEAAR